ncbi:DEAD/DEAH box helicase [Salinithrix halophila]|uniref:DEAD/DEAH box helicase n=1 Tax=Salinithrix halophila TaxID=1485204 RepID=A0ABV8JBT3_9BACL
MAQMIPDRIRKSATAGEKRLFFTFQEYLPEEYLVYYEPDIGGRRPDFVVIGPDLGLVVLEVKDYTRKTLLSLNPDQWTLQTRDEETRTVRSPLKQARENAFRIADRLKKDADLVRTEGKHSLQLKFPYGYGVVMTRWSREAMVKGGLYTVLEPKWVLTGEEIDPEHEKFSAILLRKKLEGMFSVRFSFQERINRIDLQRIRYHLFPEVRIGGEARRVPYQEHILLTLDDLETMDLHQERLAKQIGDGHRLIRGVAGSGKTLILASRACLLAKENPGWRILVLCFNISLARWIHHMIDRKLNEPEILPNFNGGDEKEHRKEEAPNIEVRHFHDWLSRDLGLSEGKIPAFLENPDQFSKKPTRYDAILIDEGQDFEPEWYTLASRMLNPETGSLLIVEDRAQSIYRRRRSYRQDTGLDFRGRSRILSVNYRNTAPIIRFAWDFYRAHVSVEEKGKSSEGDVEIIVPQSTARTGPDPVVRRFRSSSEEMAFVAESIHRLRRQDGVSLSEIMILYRVRQFQGEKPVDAILEGLRKQGISYRWISENRQTKRDYDPGEPSVKVSTIQSGKGLDAEAVFLVDAHRMPLPGEEDPEREAALFYIALTRARRRLTITYSGDSFFTPYLDTLAKPNISPY